MSKDSTLTKIEFTPPDANVMIRFVGELNENLKYVEKSFNVTIFQNGNNLKIQGSQKDVNYAADALEKLYEAAGQGIEITKETLHLYIQDSYNEEIGLKVAIKTPKKSIVPRGKNQKLYLERIDKHEVNFGIGPAGTGKTYIAVAVAAAMLNDGVVDRIILSRPAVEAGESLGFLPGDMRDKVDPYLRPLYDALYDMLPGPQVNRSLETGEIEIAPLAFMRGRTLRNAFVILDEAQNATPMQMKMFLTRMGEDSRMVITGDPSQVDLPFGAKSGLKDALEILPDVKGVDIVEFGEEDVVRHDMVTRIVKAYNKRDSAQFQFDEARKSRRKANKSMPSTASASDADEMKAD